MADEPRDGQAIARSPGSRRAFLTGGAGAATAALLAACSGSKPLRETIRGGARVARSDVPALNRLLDVEHYGIAGYAAGIPLLRDPQAKSARQFLAQELAHVVQLSDLIRRAGGKPNRPSANYDLGHPQGAQDVLALLKQLERAQLGTYLNVIPRLSGGRVRSSVAAIYANDAQHLAMLRWQSGEPPVPAALASGS